MEAIGAGLEAIGSAVGSIATATCFIIISGIAAVTYLVSTNKISFNEVKDFFKKDRRY